MIDTLKRLNVVRLAIICYCCGLLIWFTYGVLWELLYDATTPPIVVINGYIAEHTIGEYIFLAILFGIIISFISTTLAVIFALAYATIKFKIKNLQDYDFSRKAFAILITFSLVVNLMPIAVLIWYSRLL